MRRTSGGPWSAPGTSRPNITKSIASTYIVDTSPNVLNGHAINLPARGMTGYNWSADEIVYHHAPEEYGAIHFHDDDIDDARWDADFGFTAPEGLKSGFYAARLRIGGEESSATEDYIPFVVRPPKNQPSARVAVIIPTNSYLAYSNDNLATNSVVAQLLAGKVPLMQASDLYLNEHREYGLSTYSLHSDGSGVCYSSGSGRSSTCGRSTGTGSRPRSGSSTATSTSPTGWRPWASTTTCTPTRTSTARAWRC